jgi:glycerate kinase
MSGLPARSTPVLVAPSTFGGALRAPVVAAAIGRGLERAGVSPVPDLCPLAGGGAGTVEVLLPALGGETGDGFALIEDGGTALVEPGATAALTGARIAAAVAAGVEVVLVCAGGSGDFDAGAGVVDAIEDGGGLRGAALVVLCETRAAWGAQPSVRRRDPSRSKLPAAGCRALAHHRRDPRGVPMTGAGGGLAGALWAGYDATLVPGPAFVLEQLGFDDRLRAARAVVVGEARLDRGTLGGRVAGEAAIRARQAGVPCHAVVADNAIDRFDARILDLQAIVEAATIEDLEAAAARIAHAL